MGVPEKEFDIASSPAHAGDEEETRAVGRKRPIRDGLGRTGALIIFLGIPFEIGALSFLVFLWAGEGPSPGGEYAKPLWRAITLNGWTTQAVTLCTVILRTVVDLQAVVCTALAAGLMIEALDVPFYDIGMVSILRVQNGGPWSLVGHLVSSKKSKIFRSWPPALVFLLWLCSIVIQFSSTILVSDFRSTDLLSYPEYRPVPIVEGLPMFLSTTVAGSWYV
jgi:hypothetical protein